VESKFAQRNCSNRDICLKSENPIILSLFSSFISYLFVVSITSLSVLETI
jgi:hypothetical protein